MKKIAIFTMGTRGDVQPYIYLAQALNEGGFDTVLGSHPCWKGLVEGAGVKFVPIGPDIDIESEAAVIRGKVKNPVLSMLKTMNFIFKIIENSSGDVYKVCEGCSLIVVSHSKMGATEAEALNIKTVNVTLQTEMIPEKLREQTKKEKLIGGFIGAQMVRPYNKIRKLYKLPKLKSFDKIMSKQYNLIPISQYVKAKNPYWEPVNVLTGYWYREESDYVPTKELESFLEAGGKPVILALGAMSFESEKERAKLDIFVHTFQKLKLRAIIQGFQKTLEDYELPTEMLAVGSVPHSYLFKRGLFVIHHCGFGTASSAMIYGIPSVTIPHVLDQFGFAMELEKLGVATAPLNVKNLSEMKIAKLIQFENMNPRQKARNKGF